MKIANTILLGALALGVSAWVTSAQDQVNQPAPGGRPSPPPPLVPGSPGQGGQGGQRMMGWMGPLMSALDANHDGVIDETEIAHASAALKTLDKNNDGKLTPDELRLVRPPGQGGGPGNQGGNPGFPGGSRGPGGPGGANPPPPPK